MNVLFLCTGNSCRSILGEATFNYLAPPGWKALSAGSQPTGQVHPRSLALLAREGISDRGLLQQILGRAAADAGPRDHGLFQRSGRDLPGVSGTGATRALGGGRSSPRHRHRRGDRCGLHAGLSGAADTY